MTHRGHLWHCGTVSSVLDFLWMKIMSHLEAKEIPEQRLTASTVLGHWSLRMAADSWTLPATALGLAYCEPSDLPRRCNWDHICKTSSVLSQPGLLIHTGILSIYIKKCMYVCPYVHSYMYIGICISIYVYRYMYIEICIYIYICRLNVYWYVTHAYWYMYIDVCILIDVYWYMYIDIVDWYMYSDICILISVYWIYWYMHVNIILSATCQGPWRLHFRP